MSILKGGLIFVAGAAAGAVPTWFYMKKKVKEANEATQAAVDNVKASYERSEKNQEIKKSYSFDASPGMIFTPELTKAYGDKEMSAYQELVEKIESDSPDDIYKVDAEDFESDDEDSRIYLTYYKLDDMVVYSDSMIPVDEPEELLGAYFRDSFTEDDVVYIKNENEGAMYEVLLDAVNSLADDVETSNVFDSVESEPIAEGGE